jgi:hypothetical protein
MKKFSNRKMGQNFPNLQKYKRTLHFFYFQFVLCKKNKFHFIEKCTILSFLVLQKRNSISFCGKTISYSEPLRIDFFLNSLKKYEKKI